MHELDVGRPGTLRDALSVGPNPFVIVVAVVVAGAVVVVPPFNAHAYQSSSSRRPSICHLLAV